MNFDKYDTIYCKLCFYLLMYNELFCIDQGNQLLIITNTMNIIKILQPYNFNVFLHQLVTSIMVCLRGLNLFWSIIELANSKLKTERL